MVAMFGAIFLCVILALLFSRKKGRIKDMKWLQWILLVSPLFPLIAIQAGWMTAEVGRQPYVVYPSVTGPDGVFLLTADGTSASVTPVELLITIVLFLAVYLMLFVGWARVISRFIKDGPVVEGEAEDVSEAPAFAPAASAAPASAKKAEADAAEGKADEKGGDR